MVLTKLGMILAELTRLWYGTGGTDGAGGRLSPPAAPPTFTLTEPRQAGRQARTGNPQ